VSKKVTGWWCKLCNREYQEDRIKHSRRVNGSPECPSCYKPMERIVRISGSGKWMSGSK